MAFAWKSEQWKATAQISSLDACFMEVRSSNTPSSKRRSVADSTQSGDAVFCVSPARDAGEGATGR